MQMQRDLDLLKIQEESKNDEAKLAIERYKATQGKS
jgi:hypothetical protein